MDRELPLRIERGGIYLVDFGVKYQSELGKVRPALVWQSDMINEALDAAPFPSVIVIPCTTDLKGGRFRYPIGPRDNLHKPSELILQWICSLDLKRFRSDQPLTRLGAEELQAIRRRLDFVFGYLD